MAAHFDQPRFGTIFTFVDKQGQVIKRTLIDKQQHLKFNGSSYDFTVGILDSDVPTNQISFAKVLPDDFTKYIHTGANLPVITLNQEKIAIVKDLHKLPIVPADPMENTSLRINANASKNSMRLAFHKDLQSGDSGNPCFLFINNQPVILTVWTGYGAGTSIHSYKEDINLLMNQLGGGYQLEEIDFSCFNPLPTQE